MKKIWAIVGIMMTVFLGSWWLAPASECERLVRADQYGKAFPICLDAAKQGDAYAQNIVGVSYASGHGVEHDFDQALIWFRKSAGQGYANGYGVNRDVDRVSELILASTFSYLKAGNFKAAMKSMKYFHIKWPFSSKPVCPAPLHTYLDAYHGSYAQYFV